MEIRKAITLRFGIVYFAIALFGLVIVARILIIQNVDTQKWQEIAKDLRSNTTEIWAKRGNICADDGSILSTSVPYYEIRMDLMAPRIQEFLHGNRKIWLENFLTSSAFQKTSSGAGYRPRMQRKTAGFWSIPNKWTIISFRNLNS